MRESIEKEWRMMYYKDIKINRRRTKMKRNEELETVGVVRERERERAID